MTLNSVIITALFQILAFLFKIGYFKDVQHTASAAIIDIIDVKSHCNKDKRMMYKMRVHKHKKEKIYIKKKLTS
jgi:hypothetical protein